MQIVIDAAGAEPTPALSQWFTRPTLATGLVALVRDLLVGSPRVLEPSSGRGSLVRAVRDAAPDAAITAIEIDARWREDIVASGADEVRIGASGTWPEWIVSRKRHCIARPKFGRGGGTDEVVLVRLERSPPDRLAVSVWDRALIDAYVAAFGWFWA